MVISLYKALEAKRAEVENVSASGKLSEKDRHHMLILAGNTYSHVDCCLFCLKEKLQTYKAPHRRGPISAGARRNDRSFREGRTRHAFGDTLRIYRLLLYNLPKEKIESRKTYRLFWSIYARYVRPLLRFRMVLDSVELISDYYRTLMNLYRAGRRYKR